MRRRASLSKSCKFVAEMLDTGVHATLEDLARAKDVAPSYVRGVLRLTLLAPEIVEAILDGRQPPNGNMTPASSPAEEDLLLIYRHKPIRQRLHEAHERILLLVRQAQASHPARVHVVGRLRRRPARRTFAGIMGLAARQDVARVVEVHDRLQAREISVVAVGLHEARIGPLVHVAQCRHSNSRLVVWRELEPSLHRPPTGC